MIDPGYTPGKNNTSDISFADDRYKPIISTKLDVEAVCEYLKYEGSGLSVSNRNEKFLYVNKALARQELAIFRDQENNRWVAFTPQLHEQVHIFLRTDSGVVCEAVISSVARPLADKAILHVHIKRNRILICCQPNSGLPDYTTVVYARIENWAYRQTLPGRIIYHTSNDSLVSLHNNKKQLYKWNARLNQYEAQESNETESKQEMKHTEQPPVKTETLDDREEMVKHLQTRLTVVSMKMRNCEQQKEQIKQTLQALELDQEKDEKERKLLESLICRYGHTPIGLF